MIDFNKLSAIYKGRRPIVSAYKGTTMVWPMTGECISVEGYPIILNNSLGQSLIDYKIYGNSIQAEVPYPDAHVEVQSVGDRTKNLIVPSNSVGYTETKNGITYEFLSNRAAHTYGEATADFTAFLYGTVDMSTLEVGRVYRISGCPSGGNNSSKYNINAQICRDGLYITAVNDNGDGNSSIFTMSSEYLDCVLYVYLVVRGDYDLEWYPQFETDEITDYEPYGYKIPIIVNGGSIITTNIYLDEPLRKLGEYADYIDFDTQKLYRRISEIIFTGTETSNNWFVQSTQDSTIYRVVFQTRTSSHGNFINNTSIYTVPDMLCNTYAIDCTANQYILNSESINTVGRSVTGTNMQIMFYVDGYTSNDVSLFQSYVASLYDAGTPIKLYVPYADYIEEDIVLPEIPTQVGTNNITVGTITPSSRINATYIASNNEN